MYKKNNNKNESINNTDNKEIEYKFIKDILIKNIGKIIDDFLETNMGQTINKYNANTFALWCSNGINKSSELIITKFNDKKE